MESLERHGELVRRCSRCFPEGGNAPVVDVAKDVRVLLVGQAPGLTEAVGETFGRDGVIYVPLPHPSGASTWLNVPENKGRLFRALAALGELVAAGRIGEFDARARRLKS